MNILLDFDKTLTKRDTLFGFFVFMSFHSKKRRFLLLPIYTFAMICSYFGFLSNDYIKMLGVSFFLNGMQVDELTKLSRLYAKKIVFNDLYYSLIKCSEKFSSVVVATASFSCYVKNCFPDHYVVIGSELSFENGFVTGLACNNFGSRKLEVLKRLDLRYDVSISDSSKDECFNEVSDLFIIRRTD